MFGPVAGSAGYWRRPHAAGCDRHRSRYGPTIATYRGIADDPERVAGLDRDLLDLGRRNDHGTGALRMDWEYLVFIARKR